MFSSRQDSQHALQGVTTVQESQQALHGQPYQRERIRHLERRVSTSDAGRAGGSTAKLKLNRMFPA